MLVGKNILLIGLGVSGRAAAEFMLSKGAKVLGVDRKAIQLVKEEKIQLLMQQGLQVSVDNETIDVSIFDNIVVSPGVPQEHPLYQKAKEHRVPIIGEIELACRYLKGRFLGITGTNGKTTVTLLVAHILKEAGYEAYAVGNVGTALSTLCLHDKISENAVYVIELSSYQLETMRTQCLDAAVILNITPDHLDRYKDMWDYAAAKAAIERSLLPHGELFVERSCFEQFSDLFLHLRCKTYGYFPNCDLYTDLNYLWFKDNRECLLPKSLQKKSHDLENIIAAYALCKYVGISSDQFFAAYNSFKKPSHRIEHVSTIDGVSYYDDSKGTNIDAVIRAVESLKGPIILIAGGVDKGAAYTPWISAFQNKVKAICTIGEAAPKIQQQLSHAIPVYGCKNLEDAVKRAKNLTHPGSIVLLSPGCSSFDMFKDYAHRGEEFQRIVKNLERMVL